MTKGLLVALILLYGVSAWPDFQEARAPWVDWGMLTPAFFYQGAWWQVITANLLHGNLNHLANNAFGLFIFGQMLEPKLGSPRLSVLLFLSGLAGMALSLAFLEKPTLGASAMVYGLMGAYLAHYLIGPQVVDADTLKRQRQGALAFTAAFIVWNLLDIAHVNLWGHVGGFFTGFLLGAWFRLRPIQPPDEEPVEA